jgi:23S rRNA (cytosine1962-C5)-methyltransferase
MGLEVRLPILEEALRSTLAPRGAVLRNQSATRSLEGLERYSRLWFGEVPEQVPFEEAGVSYVADVLNGQKTGFFFDQAHNRAFAAPACAGLDVLDVYANTGAWGLAALKAGARSAVAIESNPATCALIEENGRRNGLSTALQVRCADAREEMAALHRAGRRYGAVFLDPPAFAKNRKSAGAALRAYREVNELAIGLVARGGLLFTSSCSHHIEEERFLGEVLEAAARRQRSPRILRRGEQAPDHPVHPAMPETRYLKHYALSLP